MEEGGIGDWFDIECPRISFSSLEHADFKKVSEIALFRHYLPFFASRYTLYTIKRRMLFRNRTRSAGFKSSGSPQTKLFQNTSEESAADRQHDAHLRFQRCRGQLEKCIGKSQKNVSKAERGMKKS
ncbi:MAG: hypothetical protein ABSE55_09055 [Terracidiphilus sp.]|jgi:hypothetical protein